MPLLTSMATLAGLGLVPMGDYVPLASVTVGSGGASSITFSSIPGTYQHLQVRCLLRSTRSQGFDNVHVRMNSDTGANYARHVILGSGATAGAYGSVDPINYQYASAATASASVFGAGVFDLLDYASTSKTKVLRALSGYDSNGSGYIAVSSGLWNSTSAISTITLAPTSGSDWAQHSTAALYGVKA